MAYIDVSDCFLEDSTLIDLLVDNGITLSNQRLTHTNDWRFDVEGEIIPDTDNQVMIWLADFGDEIKIDHVEVYAN